MSLSRPTQDEFDAALARGLAQSAAGEAVDLGDFTQYVHDNLNERVTNMGYALWFVLALQVVTLVLLVVKA